MKHLIAVILFCLLTVPSFGTIQSTAVWRVATTGSDTNGGAFDIGVGSPGTDESASGGAAITVTATTTTGTGSPAFTATTHGPGNFIHIASGAGCNTGWFYIVSQAAGTATFDRTMGTGTCVGHIGDPMLTIGGAVAQSVNSNQFCVKTGTYQISSGITSGTNTAFYHGYTSTCGVNGAVGDGGQPLIQLTAGGGLVAVTLAGGVSSISDFSFDNNGQAGNNIAISSSGNQVTGNHIITSGFYLGWRQSGGTGLSIWNSRFHGGPGSCFAGINIGSGSGATIVGVLTDHNACVGVTTGSSFVCINSVSADNTGGGDGFFINTPANAMVVFGCGAYNNAGYGFNVQTTPGVYATTWLNNWAYGNTSGSWHSVGGTSGTIAFDYNAYQSGTLASFSYLQPNEHDVILTADPTNGCGNATPNCSLNNIAGGGKALNQVGFLGSSSYPGVGYASIGPLAPQFGPSGAGGGAFGFVQ